MEHEDPRNGESSHRSSKKSKIASRFISESEIRDQFSHHQPGVARINNGSFGSCPGSVLAAQRQWQLQFLRQPDNFYFNTLRNGIMASRKIIKDLINADHVDEVSLVDNATTAAAIVLQQIGRSFAEGKYEKNDTVLMLHCAFQAVKKSIQAYVTRAGGSVTEVVRDGEEEGVRDKDGVITGYARISHQIYNTLEDYEKFRDAINRLVEDGTTCKMLSVE
ncbi:hypothetical protein COLO4_23132 [Corchorus olitorius]|uniref:Uncharacterized protein n=1 Tax=Corchorus olitorius TaxID=93759 RepID=A0A1R3II88_9ROSI|nr:hypothetical protein COLO4_23132 [Corchorus olitorius]